MKKIFRLTVFICLFSSLFVPRLNADAKLPLLVKEPDISMDFQDANLKDILKVLSIQSGLNFIASEGVQDRKVTLYMDKVPLSQAMNKIFKANNLSYELDEEASIFVVKDWGKLTVETVTEIFYLKYATVSSSNLKDQSRKSEEETGFGESSGSGSSGSGGSSAGGSGAEGESGISEVVKGLLSKSGSLIEDSRTNSLIVTDTPQSMAVISKVIASLDVAVPQVLLEIEMLDVSKNTVDKMGIKFGQTPFKAAITGAAAATGFPFGSWSKIFDPANGSLSINPSSYAVQLDWLRTQTDTRYLARPRILTLNNRTAEIRISTNESIGIKTTTEASTATTSAEPERTETGVILRVTPQINMEAGEITMFVYPKVASAEQGNTLTSNSQSYTYRDPEERSTKTMVRIKDGETVVIGGLIRNEFSQVITKLPILGDLPIIGALFRHKGGDTDKDKQRELLVFITPHIIRENQDIKLAQAKKAALPEREQGVPSGATREMLIASDLNNLEKKKR